MSKSKLAQFLEGSEYGTKMSVSKGVLTPEEREQFEAHIRDPLHQAAYEIWAADQRAQGRTLPDTMAEYFQEALEA